jgi:hypothetical protein
MHIFPSESLSNEERYARAVLLIGGEAEKLWKLMAEENAIDRQETNRVLPQKLAELERKKAKPGERRGKLTVEERKAIFGGRKRRLYREPLRRVYDKKDFVLETIGKKYDISKRAVKSAWDQYRAAIKDL